MPAKKVEKKTEPKKAETKKTTAKKTVAATKKAEPKSTAKKTETKNTSTKATTKKAQPKKAETKKAVTKTTAKKAETKKAPAKTKTAAKKAEPAKKAPAKTKAATKKAEPAKKTTAKKAEPAKKATAKKTTTTKKAAAKKPAAKKAAPKKAAAKKPATKTVNKEKMEQYNSFSLDTCIEMAYAMGANMSYDEYEALLLDEADTKRLAKQIIKDFELDTKGFTFEKDGFDVDLIEVIIERVGDNALVKASDFKNIGAEIKKHEKYVIKDDSTANNEEYNVQFDLVRRILIMAQRKDIHASVDMKKLIGENPEKLIVKFMELAYKILVHWKYDDVKYYENFIYAVLSQFEDLHEKYGVPVMMDIADLYIEHGDYGLGDANYEYILRENQIKDYIYYRYAKIYYDAVDRDKAKSIANAALQFVDDRFTYYPDIIAILEN